MSTNILAEKDNFLNCTLNIEYLNELILNYLRALDPGLSGLGTDR